MADSPVRIHRWLLPLSWLYGAGVWLRGKCFDGGLLREHRFPLPVISVGNLAVGGTGKTPHTEYLVRLLRPDWRVAVLSRGYKRRSRGFVLADTGTPASRIGDELFQMKRKFPDILVAADGDRCRGIRRLTGGNDCPPAEVILLDDAYQHRYVRPGMNILLVDCRRLVCDDALLPAGRLREPASALRRADLVVLAKCPVNLTPEQARELAARMPLSPRQRLYFTTLRHGDLQPLAPQGTPLPLADMGRDLHVLLLTGIASPARLMEVLAPHAACVHPLTFADHHDFTVRDLERIRHAFFQLPEGRRLLVTTEKDAARLSGHARWTEGMESQVYVLPVEVAFLAGQQEQFNSIITDYVRKNSRNRSLP